LIFERNQALAPSPARAGACQARKKTEAMDANFVMARSLWRQRLLQASLPPVAV